MQDNPGFHGPLQYEGHWLWLGLLILLIVAAWYTWIFWPRPASPSGSGYKRNADVAALRAACLSAIDSVVADAHAGRIAEREAHQQLSFLVRGFAASVTGRPVTSMTLQELAKEGLDPITSGIALIYPSEFAPRLAGTVKDSAAAARQAVEAWN